MSECLLWVFEMEARLKNVQDQTPILHQTDRYIGDTTTTGIKNLARQTGVQLYVRVEVTRSHPPSQLVTLTYL